MKRLALLFAVMALAGCAGIGQGWSDRLAATIGEAKHLAAAVKWIAPIAETVVAGSCPSCVAGYKVAAAGYEALAYATEVAVKATEEAPTEASRAQLQTLTEDLKEAWIGLDSAYKGNPQPIMEASQ